MKIEKNQLGVLIKEVFDTVFSDKYNDEVSINVVLANTNNSKELYKIRYENLRKKPTKEINLREFEYLMKKLHCHNDQILKIYSFIDNKNGKSVVVFINEDETELIGTLNNIPHSEK